MFTLFSSKATPLVVSNDDVVTFQGTSYDTAGHAWGPIIFSALALRNPHLTNYFMSLSRSGESWGGWWQNEEEKWGLPFWASGTSQVFHFQPTDDNGGYGTSNINYFGTNIANAPGLFWNGTAVTNEGYSFTMHFLFTGNILTDSADQSLPIARNTGSLMLNTNYGTPPIDEFHMLSTNGWLADITGARLLGFSTGTHPYQAGNVAMTITTLAAMTNYFNTNYGDVTFDWTGVSVITNGCAVVNLAKTGSTMSFSIRWDALPPGWLEGVGATNQGHLAFTAMPDIANWLRWVFKGTNFVDAKTYTISFNGSAVYICTGAQLNAGINQVPTVIGPIWTQRQSVYFAFLDLYGLDHVTLQQTHTAGENGSLGIPDLINYISNANNFYDTLGHRGSQLVSDMATWTSAIKTYNRSAYTNAQPVTFTGTITEGSPYSPAPFR